MLETFDDQHITLDSIVFESLKEAGFFEDGAKEFARDLFEGDTSFCRMVKDTIEKLIGVFRFYLMYISETLSVFCLSVYDKKLSLTPPPKLSHEELQRILIDIHSNPMRLFDYECICFNRIEFEYIIETQKRRESGYFLPSINEELLSQNTRQKEIIEVQNKQIREMENQIKISNNKAELAKILSSTQNKKSENKKDEFIKALLFVYCGKDVAEKPRKHIAELDITQGIKYSNGKIQQDFDKAGVKVGVTGRTLEKWLTDVKLPESTLQ